MSCKELPSYARLDLDVVGATGDELVLEDASRVLDLYGGHCVNTLGAGDPMLGEVLERQWRTLSFTTNLLPLGARAVFLEAFGANLPEGDWSVFLSNSGSEANENALKGALSSTGRRAVVCFQGAFHGRTAAASAVTDTDRTVFATAPFEVRRIPFDDADAARHAIDATTACVLLEPIQSMAGVVEPRPGFLELLRARCDEVGALLAFDEVQTGNGRLGTPWASQLLGVVPYPFTRVKGAAGGFPIGITVLARSVAERVDPELFGSTFGGGPLALAAATAVARRIRAGGLLDNVRAASDALSAAALRGPVARVRGRGLLLGLELQEGLSAKKIQRGLLDAGVLVGTSKDPSVLRVNPSLAIDPREAERLAEALSRLEVAV